MKKILACDSGLMICKPCIIQMMQGLQIIKPESHANIFFMLQLASQAPAYAYVTVVINDLAENITTYLHLIAENICQADPSSRQGQYCCTCCPICRAFQQAALV